MMAGSVSAAGSAGASAGASASALSGEAVNKRGRRKSDFRFISLGRLAIEAPVVEGGISGEFRLQNC